MTPPEPPSLPGPALLFCPADRPDRYAKALAAADAAILDLEDGVGAGGKDAARAALAAAGLDAARVTVRGNATRTPEHAAGLARLRRAGRGTGWSCCPRRRLARSLTASVRTGGWWRCARRPSASSTRPRSPPRRMSLR